jgi:RNA polymerase-associated protein
MSETGEEARGLSMGVMLKRSSMLFFSDGRDHYCHRVRIVLAEKGVTVEVVESTVNDLPQDVSELNPYGTLPTLVDRDLVLYEPGVMMEYLDERFPHPPLLPVYPVARAQSRLWMYRIQKDWCALVDGILSDEKTDAEKDELRKALRESLIAVSPIFAEKPFFMSDEFSLVDCSVAPILWRLPQLGIEVPTKQGKALFEYARKIFNRDAFQVSLSDFEKEMGGPL